MNRTPFFQLMYNLVNACCFLPDFFPGLLREVILQSSHGLCWLQTCLSAVLFTADRMASSK